MNIKYDKQAHEYAQEMCEQFLAMDRVFNALWLGANLNYQFPLRHGIIAQGPGGYGKSEGIKMYLEELTGESVHVISMHEQMSVMESHGGLDLHKWTQENKFTVNFENSWMNHGIVIFEEGLSVPKEVLASFRQDLTSRMYTLGQTTPIKTWMVVVCTNETIEELSQFGQSMEAFAQRFPIRINVNWEHLTLNERIVNYSILAERELSALTSEEAKKIIKIISSLSEQMKYSPRQCIQLAQAANVYKSMTDEIIVGFRDVLWSMNIDSQSVPDYEALAKNELFVAANAKIQNSLTETSDLLNGVTSKLATTSTTVAELKAGFQLIKMMQNKLESVIKESEIVTNQSLSYYSSTFNKIDALKSDVLNLIGQKTVAA